MRKPLGRRGVLDIVASLCMAVGSVVMVWHLARFGLDGRRETGNTVTGRQRPAVEELPTGALSVSIRGAPRLGHDSARVVIVEYSDFECPYCCRYAREVFPAVRGSFVDSGHLSYRYRYLPLSSIHPHALRAAAAAGCGDEQGRFWEMRAALFERQSLEDVDLLASATQAGLDLPNFKTCLDRPGWSFRPQIEEAKRLGIYSIPTFLIGTLGSDGNVAVRRRINGAQSVSVFESSVRAVIGTVGR